jgi:diguanylate cyclase (GGDEF)-like protein
VQLRTRIALIFILLLATALAASLGVVSVANQANAKGEVQRQLDTGTLVFSRVLDTNRRQLTQAAQAVASDYGFREAVATRDTDTVVSALENSGARIGANLVVLVSLDGQVMAATGSQLKSGTTFPTSHLIKSRPSSDGFATIMVDGGRVYQLVMVPVRSPLPVAWIAMGFELGSAAAKEMAEITGLGVTLGYGENGRWRESVSTFSAQQRRNSDGIERRLTLSHEQGTEVVAILSRSLAEARAPFERLTNVLYLVALVSLLASGIAAFLLARNITRPLHNLTKAVDDIRQGQYSTPLHVQRRDELGVLAEGLQLMQTAVNSRDQSIRQLAYQDSLTGLMNRTAFVDALTAALADKTKRAPLAVAVFNVERFRRINECLGYSVGDEVLKTIGGRLSARPRAADAVARLAADQFAAFSRLELLGSPQSWAASLLERFKDALLVQLQPVDVSMKVGVAVAPEHATSADELMRCADLALEHSRFAKRALAVYDPAYKPVPRDQLSLLGDLQRAVEEDHLRLYFQPKLDLRSRAVAGAEVLIRWQHPTRGLLPPSEFIPFAEQTGFIRRITRWALDRAVAQGAAWNREGKPLQLAVNISAEDIADPLLDQRVAAALTKHQLPPELLTLEVTESGFIEDPARALKMLEALSTLGVRLSIDDFGTGYSSLSYLARMPVDELKIDRSFVQGLETDQDFAAIVSAAIDMGHRLDLKVVAEGIEKESSAAHLRDLNCDLAQGYLFAKPMPRAELEQWLVGRERIAVSVAPRCLVMNDIGVLDATDMFKALKNGN